MGKLSLRNIMASGTGMSWLHYLATSSQLLILIPLAADVLDGGRYNIFLLIVTLAGFQAVMDMGFSAVFIRLLAQRSGQENRSIEQGLSSEDLLTICFRVFLWMFYITLVGFFLIALLVVTHNNAYLRMNSDSYFVVEIWVATFMMSLGVALNVYNKSKIVLLDAYGFLSWQFRVRAMATLLGVAVCSVVGVLSESIIGFCSTWLVIELSLWFTYSRHQLIKDIAFRRDGCSPKRFSKGTYRYIYGQVGKSSVGILLGFSTMQLPAVYLSTFASTATSSTFMLLMRFVVAITRVANAPFYSRIPEYNRRYARREFDSIIRDANQRMLVVVAIVGVLSILFPFVLLPVYRMVFGVELHLEILVWLGLVGYMVFDRIGAMNLHLYTLTNDVRWHVANSGASAVLLIGIFVLHPISSTSTMSLLLMCSAMLFYYPYTLRLVKKTNVLARCNQSKPVVMALIFVMMIVFASYIVSLGLPYSQSD